MKNSNKWYVKIKTSVDVMYRVFWSAQKFNSKTYPAIQLQWDVATDPSWETAIQGQCGSSFTLSYDWTSALSKVDALLGGV